MAYIVRCKDEYGERVLLNPDRRACLPLLGVKKIFPLIWCPLAPNQGSYVVGATKPIER